MENGKEGKIKVGEVGMFTELENGYCGRRKKHGKNCNGREGQKEQEREIKTKKDIKERKN
jgi:hypothetical protein